MSVNALTVFYDCNTVKMSECMNSYKRFKYTVNHSGTVEADYTHQIIKDVFLVDVDGDQSLILGAFVPGQVSGRHINQLIQDVHELLVGSLHDLGSSSKKGREHIMNLFRKITLKPYNQASEGQMAQLLDI